MNNKSLYLLLLSLFLLAGCASNVKLNTTNYYVLDYNSNFEKKELRQATPFPFSLQVNETSLPRTYDRNQIVEKTTYNKINYLSYDLWATRLYDAVPNLILQRVRRYNIYQRAEREYQEGLPNFFLDTYVSNIERVDFGEKQQAHLSIDFILRKADNQGVVFTHRADRYKNLPQPEVEDLVQTLNDMIMEETDAFCKELVAYYQTGALPKEGQIVPTSLEERYLPDVLNSIQQDSTEVGTGELLLPSLTESDNDLFYKVYSTNESENEVATGYMGTPLKLPVGKYSIRYGSDLRLDKVVEVFRNYRYTVTPDWGALVVDIIDEARDQVRMRYDVFTDSEDRGTNLASEFSRADFIERPKTVLLPAGRYKVTINGALYTDYANFASVDITEGKEYRLTFVVDKDKSPNVMLGAGVLQDLAELTDRNFRSTGAIHTFLNLASNNITDKNNPTNSFAISGEADNKLSYEYKQLHYTTRSLYDIGMNWTTNEDFTISLDSYSIKNTGILYFINDKLGIYARGDVTTHFFDINPLTDAILKDESGAIIDTLSGDKKKYANPQFYPLGLREGTGLTYKIISGAVLTTNIRTGFGWQQNYNKDVFAAQDSSVTIDGTKYTYYAKKGSNTTRGLEGSLLTSLQINALRLNITSTTDVLFPLKKNVKTSFTMENIFNFGLVKNVSLEAKIKFKYDKKEYDWLIKDYSTFLRISYYY